MKAPGTEPYAADWMLREGQNHPLGRRQVQRLRVAAVLLIGAVASAGVVAFGQVL